MPLRIELKPLELLIINGALIRNGPRRTAFLIENQCRFLRESEIILESDADTPAKQLCVTLQVLYLTDDTMEMTALFFSQASKLLAAAPSTAPFLLDIQKLLEEKNFYAAIKKGRELIAHEKQILENFIDRSSAACA